MKRWRSDIDIIPQARLSHAAAVAAANWDRPQAGSAQPTILWPLFIRYWYHKLSQSIIIYHNLSYIIVRYCYHIRYWIYEPTTWDGFASHLGITSQFCASSTGLLLIGNSGCHLQIWFWAKNGMLTWIDIPQMWKHQPKYRPASAGLCGWDQRDVATRESCRPRWYRSEYLDDHRT